jgi:hypothetical protein
MPFAARRNNRDAASYNPFIFEGSQRNFGIASFWQAARLAVKSANHRRDPSSLPGSTNFNGLRERPARLPAKKADRETDLLAKIAERCRDHSPRE